MKEMFEDGRWSRVCSSRFGILIIIIRKGNTKIGPEDGAYAGFLGNIDECGLPNNSTLLDREASSSVILVMIDDKSDGTILV